MMNELYDAYLLCESLMDEEIQILLGIFKTPQ